MTYFSGIANYFGSNGSSSLSGGNDSAAAKASQDADGAHQAEEERLDQANWEDGNSKSDGLLTESGSESKRNNKVLASLRQDDDLFNFFISNKVRSSTISSMAQNYNHSGSVQVPEGWTPLAKGNGDAVKTARNYLGINERSNQGFISKEFCQGRNEKWCADFASTVLAKSTGSPWGHKAGVSSINNWAAKNGRKTNIPKAGDAAIFSGKSHIGIIGDVQKNDDGRIKITVIQGNTGNAVREKTYLSDANGKFSQFKNFIDTNMDSQKA